MGTKTVCVHRYIMPPLGQFQKKYYFLVTSLLFEYEESGYRNDLEIYGFNEAEKKLLCDSLYCFYDDGKSMKADDFDLSMLERMISILPLDMKKMLIDHIVLSSIDKASDLRTMLQNLKDNFVHTGTSLSMEKAPNLDFIEFFKGEESSFISEYYPTEEEKNEIRLQYGMKK